MSASGGIPSGLPAGDPLCLQGHWPDFPEPTAEEWQLAPSDEELWGLIPDPDNDPPGDLDPELAALPAELLAARDRKSVV